MQEVTVGHTPDEAQDIWSQNDLQLEAVLNGPAGSPSIAAGPGLGTGPSGLSISGTVLRGSMNFTSGTSVPSGVQRLVTVNLPTVLDTRPIHIEVYPLNKGAADIAWAFFVAKAQTTFTSWQLWTAYPVGASIAHVLGYQVVL